MLPVPCHHLQSPAPGVGATQDEGGNSVLAEETLRPVILKLLRACTRMMIVRPTTQLQATMQLPLAPWIQSEDDEENDEGKTLSNTVGNDDEDADGIVISDR